MAQTPEAAFWDQYARYDPLWAVLSEGGKEQRGWSLSAFMATGEREISVLFYHLDSIGLEFKRRNALDFGCGVGRLTQAMGRRFDTALGLDISPRMIDLARRVNRLPNVSYQVHDSTDLSYISSDRFDFVYSNIVLQHIEPARAAAYLRSLVRLLSIEGLLVFQLPSHRAPERPPITPMPPEAYSAGVACKTQIRNVTPGAELELSVEVANRSPLAWEQDRYGSIRVGNHWLSSSGEMLIQDDGRAILPSTVEAGGQSLVKLYAKAPSQPGDYILVIDVVHEGVTWFEGRGSSVPQVRVSVGEHRAQSWHNEVQDRTLEYNEPLLEAALEPVGSVEPPGDFPMYAIDRDRTIAIIEEAGGRLVRLEEDDRARPEWVGFRYFVRRST